MMMLIVLGYGVKTKKKFWSTVGASELLFVYAYAVGAGCLKHTDKPTGEVAYPRSNLDYQKGEEVD